MSIAPSQSCWGCRSTACSRRFRSIWAPPLSMTSTSLVVPNRVTAQADNAYRLNLQDIANLKTRNASGEMVPIGATATFDDTTGPFRVPRYNLFPAAEVQLNLSRNFSSGQGIAAAERIAKERLPGGFAFE